MKAPAWTEMRARYLGDGRPDGIVGVVLHDTAGSGGHGDTLYLANPTDGRTVSVDFTVERDGSIWKLNPDLEEHHAYHAGRATRFKGLVDGAVNRGTVGIEICQRDALPPSEPYPPAQVASVAAMCAWLTERFRLTTSDVTTHRQIITDGSRSDPRRFPFEGPGGFWERYWALKGRDEAFRTADAMTKTPDADAPERTYVVRRGDTLAAIAKRVYGRASAWERIRDANQLTGTVIVPGQVLNVPE